MELGPNVARGLRRVAQYVRHAPGLNGLAPIWDHLRGPYGRALAYLTRAQGLPLRIGGYVMRFDPSVANLNWETVEVEAYRAFAAKIRSGDVIYDVGAHFGTYTLIALQKGGTNTRVIAYEPCDLTRSFLERHLAWNGAAERVIVRPLCCGAFDGTTSFFYSPDSPEGNNGLLQTEGMKEASVTIRTLDTEVAELGLEPSIIKIDVEGAEWQVLKGAERVLNQHRPRLFLSLHPGPLSTLGQTPKMITDWLLDRAYECQELSHDQEIHVMAVPSSRQRVCA